MMTRNHGICKFNQIPQRSEPKHRSEQVSQLLFGDTYVVIETSDDGNWLLVSNTFDGYQGYIQTKQHLKVADDYIPTHITMDVCRIFAGSLSDFIPAGCFVKFVDSKTIEINGTLWDIKGITRPLAEPCTDIDDLRLLSFRYLGVPYLWGGKSKFGIDCSGLVQQVFKQYGINMPRDAYQQAELGSDVSFAELQLGDLVFFNENLGSNKITHVGIAIDNQSIIHAHAEVRIDVLTNTGIFNEKLNIQTHNLLKIKRIFI